MKQLLLILVCLTCGAVGSSYAFAYPESYGPFAAEEKPKTFPIHTCDPIERQDSDTEAGFPVLTFGNKQVNMLQVRLTPSDKPFGIFLTVLSGKGEVIAKPVHVSSLGQQIRAAYYADFNADGKLNFIVEIGSHGCGLAGNLCERVFVISRDGKYNIVVVRTLFPGPEDFVDLKEEGRCQVIQTSLVRGEPGTDGKTHNYWVYNLIEIHSAELKLSSDIDPRFPKWIWYTYKPNYKLTTQLTQEQKDRLGRLARRRFCAGQE